MNNQMRHPKKLTEEQACEIILRNTEYKNGGLYWISRPPRLKWLIGKLAGISHHGYRRISVKGFGLVAAHRAIYFMFYEVLPDRLDHKDGDTQNNAIENLRPVTASQNGMNSKKYSNNTSGRKGVYWSKATNKWQASIKANGKLLYLGIYESFEMAVAAREIAEKEYYGHYARIS